MADLDRFPARVRLPDGRRLASARVVLDAGMARVYTANGRNIVIVFSAATTGPVSEPVRGRPTTVATAQGELSWTPTGSCGCGNPLKTTRADRLPLDVPAAAT